MNLLPSHSLPEEKLLEKLASNPEHIRRYMTLEVAARCALHDGIEVGAIRRDYDQFQTAMQTIYGRPLRYTDITQAALLCAADALHTQLVAFRREISDIPQAQEIDSHTVQAMDDTCAATRCTIGA